MARKLILGFITITYCVTLCLAVEKPEAYFVRNNTNYNVLLTKVLGAQEKTPIHRVVAARELCLFAESPEQLNQISSLTFSSYGKLNGWFSKVTNINLTDIKQIKGSLAGFDINLSKFLTSYVISYEPLEISKLISEELKELLSKKVYNFTANRSNSLKLENPELLESKSVLDKCFPGLASRGQSNTSYTEIDIARYVLGLGETFTEEEFKQSSLLTEGKWTLLMNFYQNQDSYESSLIVTNCKNILNFVKAQAEKIGKRYLNSYEILGVPESVSKTDLIRALTVFINKINSRDPSLQYYTVQQLNDIKTLLLSVPI